jgi:hypothetical protein
MPRSPLKVNRRFGGTYRLCLQGRKIRRASQSRALLANCFHAGSSETSVDFQRATRRYIPEDSTLKDFLDSIIHYILCLKFP